MTKHLTVEEVLEIHLIVLAHSGGSEGLRDRGLLESAVAQPQATFDGVYLYVTLFDKAAALGFSLSKNHPFVDGNKRVAAVAVDTYLRLNGLELVAAQPEVEMYFLGIADGSLTRNDLADWLKVRCHPL